MIQDEAGCGLDVFLVTGRAPALTGEGEEVFVLTMVAADPGKPARQVPANQEFMDHLGDDGAQAAVAGLVLVRLNLFKVVIVAVGAPGLQPGAAAWVNPIETV